MNRVWRHLLIVLALLFAQQAGLLHALQHINDDVSGKGSTPAQQHLGAKCLAFHAVDSVMPCAVVAFQAPRIEPQAPAHVALPLSRPARFEFQSRAPPLFS